jgi:hypothetical protein
MLKVSRSEGGFDFGSGRGWGRRPHRSPRQNPNSPGQLGSGRDAIVVEVSGVARRGARKC